MTSAAVNEAKVGDVRRLKLVDDLTRTRIVQYAGASGDYNPLHTDEVFARKVAGAPGVFAHGMLTMGMTGRVVTDWFGAENITGYSARFVAQVWPGDSLTAEARIDEIVGGEAHIALITTNQRDETVLTGSAVVRIDTKSEG
ncbi:MaoC/PaaZ C-terminal domain-containing protein [Nocardia arizonensis]|uniref:MaoC/PaaZ C-terminal domain-containing protein n=1 Tax=Nocardia arizonensis TaxID=1141647 RepID=UPI0006D29F40|nr:MaoC/PaaZ C-terminal domain-containing protein [Nocardia arizonensis]